MLSASRTRGAGLCPALQARPVGTALRVHRTKISSEPELSHPKRRSWRQTEGEWVRHDTLLSVTPNTICFIGCSPCRCPGPLCPPSAPLPHSPDSPVFLQSSAHKDPLPLRMRRPPHGLSDLPSRRRIVNANGQPVGGFASTCPLGPVVWASHDLPRQQWTMRCAEHLRALCPYAGSGAAVLSAEDLLPRPSTSPRATCTRHTHAGGAARGELLPVDGNGETACTEGTNRNRIPPNPRGPRGEISRFKAHASRFFMERWRCPTHVSVFLRRITTAAPAHGADSPPWPDRWGPGHAGACA